MVVNPAWIDTVSLNAFQLRRVDSLIVMTNGANPLGARSGVAPGSNGFAVSVSGTTITVGTGITSLYFAGQGTYRVAMTSTSTLTQNAPHATLPRIDLVYLRVWDNSVDASGLNQADVQYLAGTAASSPVAPTPAGTVIYMPLAQLNVPASGGGSTTVNSSVLPITVAPGGILPASSAPTSPYTGQYYDDGTNLRRYNGSSWDTYQKAPGASTAWLPLWTTSTGAHSPSYGNSTVDCTYIKVGRLVNFWMNITFGGLTNFGSGATSADNWQFSLPFTAAKTTYPIGTVGFGPGTSKGSPGIAHTSADGTNLLLYMSGAMSNASAVPTGIADSVSPWTWASGDRFTVTGQYEATT
ncbi:hypothetical protein ACFZDK_24625 [Streptomyces sp. NPDC007901]|uniref:hypothetical protein n=1 Tax=Streptomyces sp. NPDC007901 TaxID=3364785 RepID=UPI0036E41C20